MASSFLSNLGGAAASGLTNIAINKIFGQDVKPFANSVANKPPTTFNAGGLNFGFNGSQIVGGASPARQGLVGQNASFFSQQAGELAALKGQVTPGFGALTNARVQAIQNARRSAVGNLRDSLARRRVSGSSFAEDAVARTEAEFAQQEAEARATSFLQELDLKTQLVDRQYNASRGAVDAFLNEMNFQAETAKQLAQSSNAVLADNAKFAAELLSKQATSDNALLGNVGGAVGDVIGQGATSLLDGGSLSSLFGGGGPTTVSGTGLSGVTGSGSLSGPSALSLGGGAIGGGGAVSTAVPAVFTGGEAATLAGTGSQFVSGGAALGGGGAASSSLLGGAQGAHTAATAAASEGGAGGAGAGLGALAGPAIVAAVAYLGMNSVRSQEAKEKAQMGQNLLAHANFNNLTTSPNGVEGYAFTDAYTGKTVYIHPDSLADVTQGHLGRRIRLSDVGDGTPGLWDVKLGIIDKAQLERERAARKTTKESTGGGSTTTPINRQAEGAK